MSLGYNPQIKFQPNEETRAGLEKIAQEHHIGASGESANEVCKLVMTQAAKVSPKKFWLFMASMSEFQSEAARSPSPQS